MESSISVENKVLCRSKWYCQSNSCKDVWANARDTDVPLPIIEVLSILFLPYGYMHLKSDFLVEMPILLNYSPKFLVHSAPGLHFLLYRKIVGIVSGSANKMTWLGNLHLKANHLMWVGTVGLQWLRSLHEAFGSAQAQQETWWNALGKLAFSYVMVENARFRDIFPITHKVIFNC